MIVRASSCSPVTRQRAMHRPAGRAGGSEGAARADRRRCISIDHHHHHALPPPPPRCVAACSACGCLLGVVCCGGCGRGARGRRAVARWWWLPPCGENNRTHGFISFCLCVGRTYGIRKFVRAAFYFSILDVVRVLFSLSEPARTFRSIDQLDPSSMQDVVVWIQQMTEMILTY